MDETRSPAELDQVNRMAERARQVGHDLNNCLGVVGGRAELIAMYLGRGNSEGAQKGIDVILQQMAKMQELTDQLRTLEDTK